MNPTPEQLTRAAELAPRVAEIAGLRVSLYKEVRLPSGQYPLLDPRAFQAVVLALSEAVYDRTVVRCADNLRDFLTPAGMLAFYEALAAYEGSYCENCGEGGAAYKPAVGTFCDRRCMVNYLRSK